MMNQVSRLIILTTAVLVTVTGACSHNSVSTPVPTQSEPYRRSIVSLAIVAEVTNAIDIRYETPDNARKALLNGTEQGKRVGKFVGEYPYLVFHVPAVMLSGSSYGGGSKGIIVGIPLELAGLSTYGVSVGTGMAVGSLIGGIRGVLFADSPEKIAQSEAVIKEAASKLTIQETMRDQVLNRAEEQTTYKIRAEFGVLSIDVIQEGGPDTILKTQVMSFGLESENKSINPPMIFAMSVHAELLQHPWGQFITVDKQDFSCRSQPKTFAEWAESNGEPIRAELEKCYRSLAREIVVQLLGSG